MTHLSNRKLSSNTEKELKSALREVFLNLKPSDYDKVFFSLITETEELMIAKRLGTVIMLSEGSTYHEISQSLNLTNETISRIHFEMNSHPTNFKFIVNNVKPWMRKRLLKEVLKEFAFKTTKVAAKYAGGRIY